MYDHRPAKERFALNCAADTTAPDRIIAEGSPSDTRATTRTPRRGTQNDSESTEEKERTVRQIAPRRAAGEKCPKKLAAEPREAAPA